MSVWQALGKKRLHAFLKAQRTMDKRFPLGMMETFIKKAGPVSSFHTTNHGNDNYVSFLSIL